MRAPEKRTELSLANRPGLPLAATGSSGCSCCAAPAPSQDAVAVNGTGYSLDGLTCGHCVQTVEKAVTALDGVTSANVELVPGGTSRLTVSGGHSAASVREAVEAAGYSLSNS